MGSLWLCLAPCIFATATAISIGMDSGLSVLVMIMSVPEDFEWRAMVRSSLPELSQGVSAGNRPANIVTRFAIGRPSLDLEPKRRDEVEALLQSEANSYGDLALLNVTDGRKIKHSTDQHHGKVWHLYDWAMQKFPHAQLIFKQDDDTIVDWRIALPKLLEPGYPAPTPSYPAQHLYVGRLCPWELCNPILKQMSLNQTQLCAAGELYGLSSDIVRWALATQKPQAGIEDILVCKWVHDFEKDQQVWSRFLYPPRHDNAWIHPVKEAALYKKCVSDRDEGCSVHFWKDPPVHFKLPPSASTTLADAQTL